MSRLAFICTLILVASAAALAAADDEAVFARYPAPSPDGSTVAFSYHGDIWSAPAAGGRAVRLTVHEAYDSRPRWSPDGNWIAFSSDRFGNDDVFVFPATGGEARRLTFMSVDDTVCGWSADGQSVIFSSRRDWSAHRVPVLYSVPVAGGMPRVLMPEFGNEGAISPDGQWLAFTTGYRAYWWRKNYRGAGNNDIWIWNLQTGAFRRITDHLGNDANPMWSAGSDALYYITDAGGVDNLWRVDIASGTKTQVTNHTDRVRYGSISADGSVIAYEVGTELYTLATDGGSPAALAAVAPSESKFNNVERRTLARGASEAELSPDNEEIALVVRGEIFVMAEDGGRANRLTANPARDFDITWKPDGTALAFASDREGNFDIYLIESDDPEQAALSKALAFKITRLTTDGADEVSPRFSPDGNKLAYSRGQGDLHIIDLESSEDATLLDNWAPFDYSWSPDSRWIAYSRTDADFNSDVWIIPAAGGEAVNVTRHPDYDYTPVWSPDGNRLAFVSQRLEDNQDIWFVFLRKADNEKTAEDWAEEESAKKKAEPERKPEGEEGEEAEEEEFRIEIDFEDIHLRLHRVVTLPGEQEAIAISNDGKSFAFRSNHTGDSDLWVVGWDGEDLTQLTRGGATPTSIRWDKEGKKLYFLRQDGTVQSVPASGGNPTGHAFQARMSVDHRAEHLQKYEESWRVLNQQFYDPNFHGADWPAVREKFRPWAAAAVETRDFNDIVNMVFGELNASHLGIRGPFEDGPRDDTGMLGVTFDESHAGPGLKIASVLKNGPCDLEASRLAAGEYILSIDGEPVSMTVNINELLVDTIGRKVVLEVAAAPDDEPRRVILRPVSLDRIGQLLYESFVEHRRSVARELGEGRIGYLHVQSMSQGPLDRFEMELYSEAHGKDAIIIDVRNNGGGWTTDMMLAILQVRPHAYTIPRDGERGYPIAERMPLSAYWKPVVVLCNEYSYSNAEIFSWAIKTLGRGLVIGQQTNGAVISTGGHGLIDGSFIRTPWRGWYVYGTDIDQERNGCPPDIVVEVQPGDEAAGIDRQLERAVQELKAQLESTR